MLGFFLLKPEGRMIIRQCHNFIIMVQSLGMNVHFHEQDLAF